MKKVLSLLLTVALIATSIVIPVTAATAGTAPTGAYYNEETGEYDADTNIVKEVYADVDFNDVSFDFRPYATPVDGAEDTYTVSVPSRHYMDYLITNKAATDKVVRVQTSGSQPYSKDSVTFTGNDLVTTSPKTLNKKATDLWYVISNYGDDPANKALTGGGDKNQAYFQFLIDEVDESNSTDDETVYTASGVAPESSAELVYVDFKMKRRATGSDGAGFSLYSTNGSTILSMDFSGGKHAKLTGTASYGGNGGSEENVTNYGYNTDWHCVRYILDFTTHTFEMYVGSDWSELKPFVNSTENYTMTSSNAADFYRITSTSKGTFGFDDIAVYTVIAPIKPNASEVTMSGKPNIGETLTATYGSYSSEDGALEGASYCYWESSTDSSFATTTKISDDIAIKAGETSTYTITEAETGKYVRCVVVPVTEAGVEGNKAYSNANAFPINHMKFSIGAFGAVKGSNFEWKIRDDLNYYGGTLSVESTVAAPESVCLIAAWYETTTDEDGNVYPQLINVKALPVTFDASEAENGYIKASYKTDTVYTATSTSTPTDNIRLKVMLVDSLSTMNPLLNVVTYGGSPSF